MTQMFRAGMIGATRLVRAGRLGEAATVVKRGLLDDAAPPAARAAAPASLFDGMMSDMQDAFDSFCAFNPFTPPAKAPAPPPAGSAVGSFTEARFAGPAGSRPYKLYVPACAEAGIAMPLVVMLHGCSQSPDDFAAGTRMNAWAERDGFLVCYPGQTTAANGQKCWNWFNDGDQHRDRGEPALIAGITRDVMARHPVDPARVYVAGLSAGGALAATMGQAYPDLYAAVGVHSGLACGAAHDMASAFSAMRQGSASPAGAAATAAVPTIVFHGDRDGTVHPVNGDAVATQAIQAATVLREAEDGVAPGGHAYRRTRFLDADGRALVEQWAIRSAGHAWAGGDAAGSYTDPHGPDASGEMLRFFAEHVGPAAPRTP
ncbi:extracellular catalytic domain type 1 short-chain-length polyhydroxyalkanoate depolymerase [Lichenibacterium ramalinae]|uniref:Esterase n=1 Tax=Lichenibacterium ramalinae TaxID=2316527 RepID=A0A4Q2R9Z0_9HYPH|nr:PHB depolymerase family esterase [Lichenibacterium ramalinae]RYB02635.1 esterase [Lichenibacterium ramalinae]